MALHAEEIRDRLRGVFEERQAALLGEVITEAVTAGYRDLVRARDFNELKETVRDLAAKMGELAAAQARTAHLKQFGLEVAEKFVRRDVEGEEVTPSRARRNGREVLLVGEVAK